MIFIDVTLEEISAIAVPSKGGRKPIQHFIQHIFVMLDEMLDENSNVG